MFDALDNDLVQKIHDIYSEDRKRSNQYYPFHAMAAQNAGEMQHEYYEAGKINSD